jgi:DNA (cytosine-5)-methyltransferase 1
LRRITPREAARLQSFPETYILHPVDKYAYKQLGNSANVDVIIYLAEQLLKIKTKEN